MATPTSNKEQKNFEQAKKDKRDAILTSVANFILNNLKEFEPKTGVKSSRPDNFPPGQNILHVTFIGADSFLEHVSKYVLLAFHNKIVVSKVPETTNQLRISVMEDHFTDFPKPENVKKERWVDYATRNKIEIKPKKTQAQELHELFLRLLSETGKGWISPSLVKIGKEGFTRANCVTPDKFAGLVKWCSEHPTHELDFDLNGQTVIIKGIKEKTEKPKEISDSVDLQQQHPETPQIVTDPETTLAKFQSDVTKFIAYVQRQEANNVQLQEELSTSQVVIGDLDKQLGQAKNEAGLTENEFLILGGRLHDLISNSDIPTLFNKELFLEKLFRSVFIDK